MANGLQWGSISEMVGGVGSALAVLVALFIAFIEWRRAHRFETAADRARIEKKNALIGEADRLANEMVGRCQRIITREKLAPSNTGGPTREFMDEFGSLRGQLEDLLRFPNDDPRLYVELGRLKALTDFEEGFERRSGGYVASIAETLITKIEARQKAIAALQEQA